MRTTADPSPLLHALRQCTVPEQHQWAALAGTGRNYLYQIAMREREPKVRLASRICEASKVMHVQSTGRIPKVTLLDFVG